jgi:hypothetical protein
MDKKIYKIRINNDLPVGINLWYRWEAGKEFDAQLSVHENSHGTQVAVFKLSIPPFFHVYPQHCTIIGEKVIR